MAPRLYTHLFITGKGKEDGFEGDGSVVIPNSSLTPGKYLSSHRTTIHMYIHTGTYIYIDAITMKVVSYAIAWCCVVITCIDFFG